MQRVKLFLLIILVAALAVISTIGTFLPHRMMMFERGGIMGGGMMGEGFGMASFLWPTILTASLGIVVVVVTYVILFPSIRYAGNTETKQESNAPVADLNPMDIVMRVVKPDERAALEVLKSNGGVCLQKDITYKTGLSKLKTHRIVARLAERGIIQVKKVGKTNEIRVPSWLKKNEITTPHAPSSVS